MSLEFPGLRIRRRAAELHIWRGGSDEWLDLDLAARRGRGQSGEPSETWSGGQAESFSMYDDTSSPWPVPFEDWVLAWLETIARGCAPHSHPGAAALTSWYQAGHTPAQVLAALADPAYHEPDGPWNSEPELAGERLRPGVWEFSNPRWSDGSLQVEAERAVFNDFWNRRKVWPDDDDGTREAFLNAAVVMLVAGPKPKPAPVYQEIRWDAQESPRPWWSELWSRLKNRFTQSR